MPGYYGNAVDVGTKNSKHGVWEFVEKQKQEHKLDTHSQFLFLFLYNHTSPSFKIRQKGNGSKFYWIKARSNNNNVLHCDMGKQIETVNNNTFSEL